MRVVVTERDRVQAAVDLAAGRARAYCCPIVQSLKRRGFDQPSVTRDHIMWNTSTGALVVKDTPPVAAEWIERYDNHHHVGPFSFELPVTP